MVLALTVCGSVIALVVVGLFVFGLRRRLIQRSGGTFDCSLRWDAPEKPGGDENGKGWGYGVAATTATASSGTASSRTRSVPAVSWSGRRSRWPGDAPPRARRSWRCSPTP